MHTKDETWSGMSVGIPERRDRVEGLEDGGRRMLKWSRRMCTGYMYIITLLIFIDNILKGRK
jgi:hypothetical protein